MPFSGIFTYFSVSLAFVAGKGLNLTPKVLGVVSLSLLTIS